MPEQSEQPMDSAVVARIDERTKSIQTELVQIRIDLKENLDLVVDKIRDVERRHGTEIEEVKKSHHELVKKVDTEVVKQTEFALIQKIVYGFVSIIVISVVAAMLASVVIQPKAGASMSIEKQIEKSLNPTK